MANMCQMLSLCWILVGCLSSTACLHDITINKATTTRVCLWIHSISILQSSKVLNCCYFQFLFGQSSFLELLCVKLHCPNANNYSIINFQITDKTSQQGTQQLKHFMKSFTCATADTKKRLRVQLSYKSLN